MIAIGRVGDGILLKKNDGIKYTSCDGYYPGTVTFCHTILSVLQNSAHPSQVCVTYYSRLFILDGSRRYPSVIRYTP